MIEIPLNTDPKDEWGDPKYCPLDGGQMTINKCTPCPHIGKYHTPGLIYCKIMEPR